MAGQEDPVQREIHQDWANREYIEVITSSIKKIADFLNSFVLSTSLSLRLGGGKSIIFLPLRNFCLENEIMTASEQKNKGFSLSLF
ncbi:hypothetical protein FD755_009842 [Muntiacus reevesi]|uniref:BRICK1 subunit of SCAR/WAVE actin nucleating complex n=2 Tax=Muntiacus TaxID=9885 RepID=A0A5N3XWQ1_MUNRE|nr:hypothetical protein FD754_003460 [Muntiacus muntjak]KAB0378264.1 hypothetical protein FD755_009842 [Muntiacus reevesi]